MIGSNAKKRKPLISVSIPVLNEEENLAALYERLVVLAGKMSKKCDFEFLFSDNHSSDKTWDSLETLAANDPRVKAIRFSKNFGFQRSILANYMHASGDAILQVDADLQDPPELLEEFFQHWIGGYDVIYGIRASRPEGWAVTSFRRLGYWVIDKLSEESIPKHAGDFRLVDRKVVDALLRIRTSDPYIRGMIANLGFNQIGIPYDRDSRRAGTSKFNYSRLAKLGLTAIFNHSTIPLKLGTYLGSTILVSTIIGSGYYVFLRLSHPNLPQGMASLHIIVLFGIGLVSFLLGIIGEYILRIYVILRADPVAVVEKSLNIPPSALKL